ncbi:MAG TPA: DUF2231 domain-containing protein [Nocardioides sp.]|nr:DUF2231 domain-containing protein [Nocardioides sp.]
MTNLLVRAARRVETASGLDAVDAALRPAAEALVRDPQRRAVLHGHWLGHAVHPLMTDFPLGMWTSGTLLDVVSGAETRAARQRLIGIGILAALPTAVTGLAEWGAVDQPANRRTGVVHAAVNTAALGLYTASWLARRRGDHARGTTLGLAGGVAATVGGFFGGHLTEVRKVSSRHPSFEAEV